MAPFIPTLEGLLRLALAGPGAPCAALNTVQHHDMHHRHPTKHFSLYFTHWDRWCGTLHPRYDAELFSYYDPPAAGTEAAAGKAPAAKGGSAARTAKGE